MEDINLVEVKNRCIEAALLAGEEIKRVFYVTNKKFNAKEGIANLVTETDVLCEERIIEYLQKYYPNFKVISEETHEKQETLTDSPTFCIDPIDGTTNFYHGFPMVAISIGVLMNQTPILGVCHLPMSHQEETFWAISGKGAYLYNGKENIPIHVSKTNKIEETLILTNNSSGLNRTIGNISRHFQQLSSLLYEKPVHSIRFTGSAVASLCYVACGRADCYFETGIQSWDMTAGVILVKEAGGLISEMQSDNFSVLNHNVLACNSSKEIYNHMRSILK